RPTDGAYPVLMITEKSGDVLRGTEKVYRKERVRIAQIVKDDELFERLRMVRKEIAEAEKVPPYIIFSDVTLREMSAKLPMSKRGRGAEIRILWGSIFAGDPTIL